MSWTKLQIVTKVEEDLDLQEETIIAASEMTGYLQAAVRDCRAVIETIEADYYLESALLPMVAAASEIALPSDIFASKIRAIIYNEGAGGAMYPVRRIRSMFKFLEHASLSQDANAEYKYFLINQSAAAGVKIKLAPAARVTSSLYMTVWYRRDAAVLSADADVCDVPEFIDYVFAHMKKSCLAKMNDGIAPPEAVAELLKEEKRMVETLTQMEPDNDDGIEADFSHYEEST